MAKKPLGEPQAPPGPQYEFFDVLQRYVRRYGNKSLAELVSEGNIYCTRQALHRALVGPKLPSRKLVHEIVRAVNCTIEEAETVLSAYDAACNDQLAHKRRADRETAAEKDQRSLTPHVSMTGHAAQDLNAFLHDLYLAAGRPSLREIENHASRLNPAVRMSKTTIHGWLTSKTIPMEFASLEVLIQILTQSASRLGVRPPLDSIEAAKRLWVRAVTERQSTRMSAGSPSGPSPKK
ncbi:hypothetical protein ABZ490_51905 [Streptomyces sp. NPDC005811]|uniref:hypothetical protein n=1 Tax=Streptomyces sp. NPDC005811 TaxID=3154565 RepID=UPI00340F8976